MSAVVLETPGAYGAEAFAAEFDVPRGTMLRLQHYAALLVERQATMNLIASSTLPNLWDRHFRDSAQLARIVGTGLTWLDIGAGGGFPGLVLATLGAGRILLVESVGKKCAFLQEVIDSLTLDAQVLHDRVETLPPQDVDVITARAVAPLVKLLDWGYRHAREDTRWVLPKGRSAMDELSEARNRFRFSQETVTSVTNPDAAILVLRHVQRKTDRR